MLKSLFKAAAAVITVPVGVIADVVTMGGVCTGQSKPYTAVAVSDMVKNLKHATDPTEE